MFLIKLMAQFSLNSVHKEAYNTIISFPNYIKWLMYTYAIIYDIIYIHDIIIQDGEGTNKIVKSGTRLSKFCKSTPVLKALNVNKFETTVEIPHSIWFVPYFVITPGQGHFILIC